MRRFTSPSSTQRSLPRASRASLGSPYRALFALCGALLALAACGDDDAARPPGVDAGETDGAVTDLGSADLGSVDLGSVDLGSVDLGSTDGGGDVDLGGGDGGSPDLGVCADGDGDGFASAGCGGDDCDDARAAVNPGATEVCNGGVDDDCDGAADAADGVCVACPSGYAGVDGACTDVDECAVAGFCGAGGASCTNLPGSFACTCAAGYAAASPTGALCVNVDECAAAVNPCGAGTCFDNAGSYACACPAGYRAEGVTAPTCVNVNECDPLATPCDTSPAAPCTNTVGGFTCTCPSGYMGDGRGASGCVDINECASLSCGPGTCVNTVGAYSCTCLPGFIFDGMTCVNVDECATIGTCSRGSPGGSANVCTDTVGGYLCTCGTGYVLSGTGASATCADVNECLTASQCARTRPGGSVNVCTNVTGGYTCTCGTGYIGSGSGATATCVENNECFFGTDDCDDSPAATCTDTLASFTCACPAGFVGTGRGVSGCLLNDPGLSGLVGGMGSVLSPAFVATTLAYQLALPPGATSTTLTATLGFPDRATLTVDGMAVSSGTPVTVTSGTGFAPRVVSVVVTAEGGATRTYSVAVVRGSHYMKASNTGAGDAFNAVALSADGSTLAVGAFGEDSADTLVGGAGTSNAAADAGAVYVYRRAASGAWAQEAYIKASNTGAGDLFGYPVSLSADGSVLAVGAPSEDGPFTDPLADSEVNSGAAYVYRRTGTTWAFEARLKPAFVDASDNFGWVVDISSDGTVLAVGAYLEDSDATTINGDATSDVFRDSGAAYVFRRSSGGSWAQEAFFKASNTNPGDSFGWSIALSGDGATLAVGARFEASAANRVDGVQSDNSSAQAGAVYVFRNTAGTWAQEAYVKPFGTGAGDYFGWSVALSENGSLLAVGAPSEDSAIAGVAVGTGGSATANNAASGAGAVCLFSRSATNVWTQSFYVKASNPNASDSFGQQLSLSSDGTVLLVMAPGEQSAATGIGGDQTSNAANQSGAGYVFRRSATTWVQEAYVKASNTAATDSLGAGAISGDASTLAVGAYQEDSNATGVGGDQLNNAAADSGAVYVY